MKKFINKPEKFVDEMLEGIMAAHPSKLKYVNDDLRCVVSAADKVGKVGIATGGGSGHLPLFLGYVGDGMLDGCAVGDTVLVGQGRYDTFHPFGPIGNNWEVVVGVSVIRL